MTKADCCADTAAGESCPATASAKPTSQFMNTLYAGGRWAGPLIGWQLPAEAHAEEIGTPENAEILPGVIEAEVEPAFTGIVDAATEREALQIFLVGKGGGRWIDRREIIGTGIAVASPGGKSEGGPAEPLGVPLSAKHKSRPGVIGLVEVGDEGQAIVVPRNQVIRQTDPENGRQIERLRAERGRLRIGGHVLLSWNRLPRRLGVEGRAGVRQVASQVGDDKGEPNRVTAERRVEVRPEVHRERAAVRVAQVVEHRFCGEARGKPVGEVLGEAEAQE